MDHDRDTGLRPDPSPARTAADVLASLARSRADIAAGRIEDIDIDALCDEMDAEAAAIEVQPEHGAPSAT